MNIIKYILIFIVTATLGVFIGKYGIAAVQSISSAYQIEKGDYSEFGVSANSPVKIYITDWCPFCKKTTSLLDKLEINYIQVDIEKDPIALKEFEALKGKGLPVILISDGLIRGFNQAAIEKQLEKTQLL